MGYSACRVCGRKTFGGAGLCGACLQGQSSKTETSNESYKSERSSYLFDTSLREYPSERKNVSSSLFSRLTESFQREYQSDYYSQNGNYSTNSFGYSKRNNGTSLQPSQVTTDNIPSFIDGQINAIKRLNNNAARARQTQELAEYSARHALQEAESARERAKQAAELSAGFGKKKAAIEALQQTVVSMSDALNETTQAQEDAMEAQIQLSEVQQSIIEYQEKVTEVSQVLVQMGALSIAQNRAVVRELELRLKGASEEELGDLAQQELKAVFTQLKQQLDLIERIDRMEEKHKDLRLKYDALYKTTTELSSVASI